jgi:hypothetical protein
MPLSKVFGATLIVFLMVACKPEQVQQTSEISADASN